MIKKVLEIKKLGLFEDFKWNPNLKEFARFNVIYGWNGSGKTTLSVLFSALEKGHSEIFENLRYKIVTDEGEFSEGSNYPRRIRVFNQRYITQNIDLETCKATPIFILGEENKALADSIKQDEIALRGNPAIPGNFGKLELRSRFQADKATKEKEYGLRFTNIARNISEELSGTAVRNYNKNNAEADFKNMKSIELLSIEQLENVRRILQQNEASKVNSLSLLSTIEDSKQILATVKQLLQKTVAVNVISRLKQNPDISKWVETGVSLHKNHSSSQCEFCGQDIPMGRLHALAEFFNEEDKKFKDELDAISSKVESLINLLNSLRLPEKSNIFPDLQIDFEKSKKNFLENSSSLVKSLKCIKDEIDNKKFHTNESMQLNEIIDLQSFIDSADNLESYIRIHNDKVINFIQEKNVAAQKLKNHLLSEIYDDINKMQQEIGELSESIQILENGDPNNPQDIGIDALSGRISENKQKISKSGIACDELNQKLSAFLGRDELSFETCDNGYLLKRNGVLADNLSEGEKTAVAFVYFTIHLKDQDFNPETDIVVVDDPISSLDSSSLFLAFSFLKNSVKGCNQVFVFTHNHDFLRLIIGWLKYEKENHTSYYMVNNYYDKTKRIAKLEALDQLLLEFSSEYQYLFKLLYNYSSDGTIESAYKYPNLARKVLDHFLNILYPDSETPYKKLKRVNFDENKKDAIYRFTNDQSHISDLGFDPALASETEHVISSMLEMMNAVFPSHYESLENCAKGKY